MHFSPRKIHREFLFWGKRSRDYCVPFSKSKKKEYLKLTKYIIILKNDFVLRFFIYFKITLNSKRPLSINTEFSRQTKNLHINWSRVVAARMLKIIISKLNGKFRSARIRSARIRSAEMKV